MLSPLPPKEPSGQRIDGLIIGPGFWFCSKLNLRKANANLISPTLIFPKATSFTSISRVP